MLRGRPFQSLHVKLHLYCPLNPCCKYHASQLAKCQRTVLYSDTNIATIQKLDSILLEVHTQAHGMHSTSSREKTTSCSQTNRSWNHNCPTNTIEAQALLVIVSLAACGSTVSGWGSLVNNKPRPAFALGLHSTHSTGAITRVAKRMPQHVCMSPGGILIFRHIIIQHGHMLEGETHFCQEGGESPQCTCPR